MDGQSRPDTAPNQDADCRCDERRLRVSGLSLREGQTLSSCQESDEVQGDDPSGDAAELRAKPPDDHRDAESETAWLVRVLPTQLQDDVRRIGRLGPWPAAQPAAETARPTRPRSGIGSSALAECLLCQPGTL